MKTFSQWINENYLKPAEQYFKSGQEIEQTYDPNNQLGRILRLALVRFPDDTFEFFERISFKDEEVKNLINKLKKETEVTRPKPTVPYDEKIVPNASDFGYERLA